jgi:hypothetical protein
MNQNLRQILFWMTMACSISSNAQIQIINLSTGWNNGVVALNIPEDSWMVTPPSGAALIPRSCGSGYYQESGCSRWISPSVATSGALNEVAPGTYTYKLLFNLSTERLDCARLVINAIGADNVVTGLFINNNNYTPTMPAGNNNFNPLTQNVTFYLNPAHLINGTNTLTVTTVNLPFTGDDPKTTTGFNFCGEMRINDGDFNIHPIVTGATSICQGNPLVFGGSLAAGSSPSTDYSWRLLECDAAGNLVNGGFSWEMWYTGVPTGNFTFPSNLNLTCGKYYMAVLSALRESGCANWAQDIHVFYYTCKPNINAGLDKTICQGECVSIGANSGKGVSYGWFANGVTVGSGASISVCPGATTTYINTATNNFTGCSNADQVVITVLPNNPDFDIQTYTFTDYYTLTATPVVMNANSVAGFGQYWGVEELVNNVSQFNIQNPSVWWPYPAACNFPGFDDYSLNYTGTINTLPSAPAAGRFLFNHTYRITRGTWNNNCGWNAVAYLLERTKSANGDEIVISPTKAPDFRPMTQKATMNNWSVSPNPSNGVFNILSESQETEKTVFEVFDLFGKKIESKVIEGGTTSLSLNLSDNAKGIYILNITTDGVSTTHKITIE